VAEEKLEKELKENESAVEEMGEEITDAVDNEADEVLDQDMEEEIAEKEAAEETEEGMAEEAEEGTDEGAATAKKGFFSKKKEKKDKRDVQIEELTDRLQRQMAEFDNFRKRTEKEKSAMYEIGAKSVIEKILPVIDNFERGLAPVWEERNGDAFVDGMEKVYKQFIDIMQEVGVQAIEAVGQEFDPNLHNAVMHIEDEEAGDNIIVEEFQKGYMYRDCVVRHSMVKVAN